MPFPQVGGEVGGQADTTKPPEKWERQVTKLNVKQYPILKEKITRYTQFEKNLG